MTYSLTQHPLSHDTPSLNSHPHTSHPLNQHTLILARLSSSPSTQVLSPPKPQPKKASNYLASVSPYMVIPMVASEAASSQGHKTTTMLKEYGRYSKGKGELWKISDQAHRYAFEFANTNNTGASGNSKAVGEYRDIKDDTTTNNNNNNNNNNSNNNNRSDGKPSIAGGMPSDKSSNNNSHNAKSKAQVAVSSSALKRISAGDPPSCHSLIYTPVNPLHGSPQVTPLPATH